MLSVILMAFIILGACQITLANRLQSRIKAGGQVDIKDYKYMASIRVQGKHSCGGAIIGDTWILTAAHCVFYVYPKYLTGYSGSADVDKGGTLSSITHIYIHPKFDGRDYDIAILGTAAKINFTAPAGKIDLPKAGYDPPPKTFAVVTGWGRQLGGKTIGSNILNAVEIPIQSRAECERRMGKDKITDRMLCTNHIEGIRDACEGDDGGPLVADNKLIGLVSWGIGCGQENTARVYTHVGNLRGFIKKITGL